MTTVDNIDPAFIEIEAGTVTASHSEGAEGRRHHDEEIGTFRFYVSVVERDGSRIVLWSGTDYEVAMREAEQSRVEWEIDEPVHDVVIGGRT